MSEWFDKVKESPAGKAGIVVIAVVAVGAAIFAATHAGGGSDSRVVAPTEAISEAQAQIDAINKMTNLTPEQKKAMIAHEQGTIDTAKGSVSGGRPMSGPPGGAPPGN